MEWNLFRKAMDFGMKWKLFKSLIRCLEIDNDRTNLLVSMRLYASLVEITTSTAATNIDDTLQKRRKHKQVCVHMQLELAFDLRKEEKNLSHKL